MAGNVELRIGDLFDKPADVLVIPCSTGGTITNFVAKRLAQYRIPQPRRGLRLGEVEFRPLEGAEHVAQYAAFAASVRNMYSNPDAIRSIGRALGDFTRSQSGARLISAPALGSGAGGLSTESSVENLRDGFTATAAETSLLLISILDRRAFDHFDEEPRHGSERRRPVRVFISYTAASPEHAQWAEDLATYLHAKGIEARFDKWHLRKGMDLQQWMINELRMADKVLVVSDEAYKKKADGHLGGVGWETRIIQQDIEALAKDSTKYQVVIRSERLEDGLPIYLSTRYVFHCPARGTDEAFRRELLQELLDAPRGPRRGESTMLA